ncbi:MAG: alkaline phosphatase family protein [Actinomycetota bacterium]|nr:alkaline phosphatase family protein [Actinomycetota bacterium]
MPTPLLQRMWRGYYPGRSGDVLMIERRPHQFGTRHSTPYSYTQNVPIVLYGPGYIRSGVISRREVTVADLAPTYAELLEFGEFKAPDGTALSEALLPPEERNGIPKLLVTIVWDGGGDNVLERWPDHWPNLKSLMESGASFENATAGSSPSITPAIHASIGTGGFPSSHAVTEIRMRVKDYVVDSWVKDSPRHLKLPTLADLWDAAQGNRARVGFLARDAWQLGMMGHGSYLEEGDRDIAVLDDFESAEFYTNPKFYSMPDYVNDFTELEHAIQTVDLRDGSADSSWLGNEMLQLTADVRQTPAWPIYQTNQIIRILDTEDFGEDAVADLFFTNYKSTDMAGHTWNMIKPEVRDNLAEQDHQLMVLVKALDRLVGPDDYVLAVTADHGMTPLTTVTGGWSISLEEMTADIDAAFGVEEGEESLIAVNRGYQLYLDRQSLKSHDVTPKEIARFLVEYEVRDNSPNGEELGHFDGDKSTRLFLTALTPSQLKRALACATRS